MSLFSINQKSKPVLVNTKGLCGVTLNNNRSVLEDSVSLDSLIIGLTFCDGVARVTFLDPGGRTTDLIEELRSNSKRNSINIEYTDMNNKLVYKIKLRKAELSVKLLPNGRYMSLSGKASLKSDEVLDFPI